LGLSLWAFDTLTGPKHLIPSRFAPFGNNITFSESTEYIQHSRRITIAAMAQQDMLMSSINACTVLGNRISLKMVDFLNQVKDQPVGFRDLGLNFLGICQILSSLAESLHEHFRTNQPFPDRAIPELTRVIANTTQDFMQLQTLLQKFMDFEKGGTLAKLQKTWRLIFADKDIAEVRTSLQENRGALNMTMLLTNM
jgi:hypothetical protein